MLQHGSLFSGIGGFDLAAEWMGWQNVFHCEFNEFGKQVLNHYWPKAISYDDITKTDFTIHRRRIDILTGGFPCQPYSTAGKRLGKEDDRHLWPEMLRAIIEIQPTWVVGENVYGIVNWNDGLVFNEVQADLEAQGYEVQPFILPAAGVNAPHKRERVWFIAYSDNNRKSRTTRKNESKFVFQSFTNAKSVGRRTRFRKRIKSNKWQTCKCIEERSEIWYRYSSISRAGFFTNACNFRCNYGCNNWQKRHICYNQYRNATQNKPTRHRWKRRTCSIRKIRNVANTSSSRRYKNYRQRKPRQYNEASSTTNWQNFPTQSPICNGNDGLSAKLDGITFPKWRTESIKAGGNAIVPQVALQIFKTIQQYEDLYK